MKNPNGFGTVYKVTGNRRKPWRAIKTIGFDISKGRQVRKTVGYFETRKEALESLITFKFDPYNIEVENLTIDDIYNRWKEIHFKKLSKLSQSNYESNYTHFKPLKDRKIAELKTMHLQDFMNNLELSESSKRNIKRMLNQLFKYALKYDIIEKDYTQFIELGKVEKILERKIFTDEEIAKLWKYKELEWIDTILIMIYTGMRVGELLTIKNQDIDLENRTIRGGIKTDAGKNRVIPINMKILPFIKARMSPSNEYLIISKKEKELAYRTYSLYFKRVMQRLEMKHTIHDCRHTFASLLSNADANKVSIAKIIGHSNYDMTEKIYTHKDIEELKKAIDLI